MFGQAEWFYSDSYIASVSLACVTRGLTKTRVEYQIRNQLKNNQSGFDSDKACSLRESRINQSYIKVHRTKYLKILTTHAPLSASSKKNTPLRNTTKQKRLLPHHPQRPDKSTSQNIPKSHLYIPDPLHLDQKVHNPPINNISRFFPSSIQPIRKCITAVLPVVFIPRGKDLSGDGGRGTCHFRLVSGRGSRRCTRDIAVDAGGSREI